MVRRTKAKMRLMESRRTKWSAAGKPFMILCLDCNLECEQLNDVVTTKFNIGNCPRQTGGILSGKERRK